MSAQSPSDLIIESGIGGNAEIRLVEKFYGVLFGHSGTATGSSDGFVVKGIVNSIVSEPFFFIDREEGRTGIWDVNPAHQLSLGSSLARTKLALYERENNTSNYGMGVTAGHFNFNLGNSNAEYNFYDQPGSGLQESVFG